MNVDWQELARRANGRGANGEFYSLATGQESEPGLRSLCRQLTEKCPIGRVHHGCPFRMLEKLPHYSVEQLLSDMSETELRELLVMELICRKMAQNGQTASGHSGS